MSCVEGGDFIPGAGKRAALGLCGARGAPLLVMGACVAAFAVAFAVSLAQRVSAPRRAFRLARAERIRRALFTRAACMLV